MSDDKMSKQSEKSGILRKIKFYLDRNRLGELLVMRQKLAPWELKEALSRQQTEKRQLGDILVEAGFVTRGEIRAALATQMALRSLAAIVTLMISATSFAPRSAYAGTIRDIPASVVLASAAYGNVMRHEELFGTGERRSNDLSAFTKWSAVFDRFSREASSGEYAGTLKEWKANLSTMRGLPLEDMASEVNDMVNKVRYINDSKNWGVSDYWETPVEFFTKGGDCEDFAITKYASLRALGVPDDRMRIAIVKDMEKNLPHAILIVYTDSGAMVLDNQIKAMRPAGSIHHYKPIFSINRAAWWLHTDRASPTQIAASAQ